LIIYHGTTVQAANKIKKEGLIPHRESAFDTIRSDDGVRLRAPYMPMETEERTYVTTKKTIAVMFAQFRTKYERAKPGEAIPWGNIEMIKHSGRQMKTANPAVIQFDIPDSWKDKLEEDVQAISLYGALTCLCTIPPQYVRTVEFLPTEMPENVAAEARKELTGKAKY
jgi:hypothetical protein